MDKESMIKICVNPPEYKNSWISNSKCAMNVSFVKNLKVKMYQIHIYSEKSKKKPK
jgi:hypothetical protein